MRLVKYIVPLKILYMHARKSARMCSNTLYISHKLVFHGRCIDKCIFCKRDNIVFHYELICWLSRLKFREAETNLEGIAVPVSSKGVLQCGKKGNTLWHNTLIVSCRNKGHFICFQVYVCLRLRVGFLLNSREIIV